MVDRLVTRGIAFVFCSCLFVSVGGAMSRPDPSLIAALGVSKPSDESTARTGVGISKISLETTFPPSVRESHFSLLIPSTVVHGFEIDKDVASHMPNKVDGGQTVMTPGLGLQYVSSGGFLMMGGVLKDCYNDLAGLFQVGQQFKIASHTTFGYSLGIYARETPMTCRTTFDARGRKRTACDEFDAYSLKWLTEINGESVDIIPMPFLHFTTALYRDRNFELDLKIMSNFALNEFGFAVPF